MPDLTDPTHPPSRLLGRRSFARLSAGAAMLGATAGAAAAQAPQYGKPHPPIVAEDDPRIIVSHPAFASAGRTIDAYLAAPRDVTPQTPGVVLVQAIWGVDAQLRDVARRFATLGYLAIAPNLYAGLDAPPGDGATDIAPYRAVAAKLVDSVVDLDLAAAADHVRGGDDPRRKIGVTGFCMGGGITLRQCVDNARRFDAAAMFYGKVRYGTTSDAGEITPIALAYADEIGVPLCGSFGERDPSIRADDVRALDAKLATLGKPHDIRVYDGAGHAFFDDTRPSYEPHAAQDAWTRTLAWFAGHLR